MPKKKVTPINMPSDSDRFGWHWTTTRGSNRAGVSLAKIGRPQFSSYSELLIYTIPFFFYQAEFSIFPCVNFYALRQDHLLKRIIIFCNIKGVDQINPFSFREACSSPVI
jgi:hypothetical protein